MIKISIIKKRKYLKLSLFTLVLFFSIVLFLSNRTLIFLFQDKIWSHKTNTISQLKKSNQVFSGAEFDLVFYPDINSFDINHPPDKSTGLSLNEYFKSQHEVRDFKYWIDYKNLDQSNMLQSSNCLDSIVKAFELSKRDIIVESIHPPFLLPFYHKGFLISYYLPPEMYKLDKASLKATVEQINKNLNSYENIYISFDYKDYPIVKEHFPNHKKLSWFTVYGSMNKISARLLLFKILLDENVDVLLLPNK